jgi:uncharacterized membrane protein YfcA
VSTTQILSTVLLIVVLAGLAGYYAWRQVQTLRGLRQAENLPPEDRSYLRNQAWRRLACSALMVVFAGLLAGSFWVEPPAQALVDFGEEAQARNERPDLDPGQKHFFRLYTLYWVAALLVLLAMMGTALVDIMAIRRYGQRHFRKLQADRRAMIERQAARLRGGRNGNGNGHA